MGFWGTFVVHHDERLLRELLPHIDAFGEAELCYDGAWQVTRVFAAMEDLPPGLLVELRDITSAPVLAAEVMDSDAALVTAVGRRTPNWKAWLQLDRGLGHLAPPSDPWTEDDDAEAAAVKEQILLETLAGPSAAAAAIAWAGEAGLEPGTAQEVTDAFTGEETFVEDLFFTLVNRLGIATDKAPEPPAIVDVLRSLVGRRLDAIDAVAHQPVRGERLAADLADLRLQFDGRRPVIACACRGTFVILAPIDSRPPVDISLTPTVFEVLGRSLTDAATIGHRFLPGLKGVALRFGESDLVIVASDGRWITAATTTAVVQALGPDREDEIRQWPWLAPAAE